MNPLIKSHAFSPRKLITDPAVLKMKLTIETMRPGKIPTILLPSVLKPFQTPLATDVRSLVNALTVIPTAETVKPYFLRMFLTLSPSEVPSSSSLSFWRASICSWFSIILSHALSPIAGCSFSSSAIFSSSWIEFCSSSILLSFWAIKTSRFGPSEVSICFRSDGFNLYYLYPFMPFSPPQAWGL